MTLKPGMMVKPEMMVKLGTTMTPGMAMEEVSASDAH